LRGEEAQDWFSIACSVEIEVFWGYIRKSLARFNEDLKKSENRAKGGQNMWFGKKLRVEPPGGSEGRR